MVSKELRMNHRPAHRYIHPTGPDTVLVRLRVYLDGGAIPESCFILYSCGKGWESAPMLLSVTTRDSVYYGVELQVPQPELKYSFEIITGDAFYSYGNKYCAIKDQPLREIIPFRFKWNPHEVFVVPEWIRDSVFYQIFPERFFNGNPQNDPHQVVPWDSCPGHCTFVGGDLEGIEQKIPYLVDLGVTALWLNPIFFSLSNHKYNTSDFLSVDPHFGDEEILKRLVQKLHANGIRIILDCVFNHTGTDFWAFRDVLEHGEASQFKDWYYINEFPVKIHPKANYECWWDISDLPKLRVSNPEVKDYLLEVAAYWTKNFEIDGWRLDVPNEVSHDFWKEFRKVVKGINSESYIVGEIWDDGRPWLQGDQFDAVMNYLFRDNCLDFFARKKMSVSDFEHNMGMLRLRYSQQVNHSLLNLLGSHDTPRVLTVFKEERPHMAGSLETEEMTKKMRPAIIFQMTYLGTPMVYYGDEVGMSGGPDPGCRQAMVWNREDQDVELRDFYASLIKLRRNNEALRRGTLVPLVADDAGKILAFARIRGKQVCLVLLNLNSKDIQCSIPVRLLNLPQGMKFRDSLSGKLCTVKDDEITIPVVQGDYGSILVSVD